LEDWVRAILILCFGVFIPCFLLVNMVKQRIKKWRGLEVGDTLFTPAATMIIENLQHWRWVKVLNRSNLIAIAYWIFFVGFQKITYVFLSWLNECLSSMNFALVLVILFVIGYTMFLLPPVPGVPVYVVSGIILASRAESIPAIGYVGGTAIAVVESFVLKLLAVCGQYAIGYFMGKSVKVQKMVGVDKLGVRTVELILQKRGLNLPKVSVLVGGPDWPTSVLCGILKLNLFQCVLGTVPVIFVSTPCVVSGAFMARVGDGDESSIWDTLSVTMVAIAGLGQLGSLVLALYYIQETAFQNVEQLSKPDPRYAAVEELAKQEAQYDRAYAWVTEWKSMLQWKQALLLASTACFLASGFLFVFMDSYCFRTFNIRNKISDPWEKNGLRNQAHTIVRDVGWAANGIFFIGCILHYAFSQVCARDARAMLKNWEENPAEDPDYFKEASATPPKRQRSPEANEQSMQ
jgi:hypothetical protein